ncbi:MAG TPA: sigma-54-dependent Fis family transcriptional regulator [Burkholderiales bacterium]|nr:sigma-54-dependent Fis family transcriptional regulator [Burkholderiales bacterium]
MSDLITTHAKFIHSVLKGAVKIDDERITRSWRRCIDDYHLDPASTRDPVVVDRSELIERQERMADVLSIAKIEMTNLYQQLAGSGYAIMLTDVDGVLLNYFGDPEFTHTASKTGLMLGAVWSEQYQGTNGMGTCLLEKKPLIVHHREHFLARNIGLTCSAAPIFDHSGKLLAVLDASGESRLAQQHTLVLVNMSAQMIENRAFLSSFSRDYIVRFHSRPEFVGTLGEGAIAFTGEGRVLAANHSALFQLGYQEPRDAVGKDIGELFNTSLHSLVELSARNSFHPMPIFEARRGSRFFAVAQQPEGAKPLAPLVATVVRGLRKTTRSNAATTPLLDELAFGDPLLEKNIGAAKRILSRDVALLLYGETGTGKEMFAKALHYSSNRADKPFVAINCASIPETLIESELFGYKAGAFTGASREGQRGKIFQANGGTLFLDEIGDMPIQLQARLLRVLEEREILPLGGEVPVKVDIRLISATHSNLADKIIKGEFRQDLYYRLHGLCLTLPPLRERTDKCELIKHILAAENPDDQYVEIDDAALGQLEHYLWPGNIRQLRNVLRTVLALREGDVITVKDLPQEIVGCRSHARENGAAAAALNPLESAERDALVRELGNHHWNITSVARQLKISRNTLYRKMQRLNIKDPNKDSSQ